MVTSRRLALVVMACTCWPALPVCAHGTPPRITQIAMSNTTNAVVATTRGLIFGDPSTGAWSLLCGEAFGVDKGVPFRIAQLPTGRLFLATLRGLSFSDDRGCSFRPHPALGTGDITFLTQHPRVPSRLYVTVFGAGEGGVRESLDGGETFIPRYRAEDDEFVNSVLPADSDPSFVYATLSTTGEVARLFVIASSDSGTTWRRSELSVREDVLDVGLLAVHPLRPQELLLRVRHLDDEGDDLLRSVDGGRTFASVGRYPAIASAAYADDGEAVFVVMREGLLQGPTTSYTLTLTPSSDRMTYAAVHDQVLLLGGYYLVGDRLNASVRATPLASGEGSGEPWMSFDQVTSPVSCPAPSTVNRACMLHWIDWEREFLLPSAP